MKRRLAVLLILLAAVAAIPAATAATHAPGVLAPVTRLLCGCDLASAATETVTAVSSRVKTVSMSIVHVFRGCHVLALGSSQLGPTPTVEIDAGTRLKLRISCPMDFDVTQVAGPRLAVGDRRFYSGSTRLLVFRKPGVYRLVWRNVQTSEEVGLQTLGADNVVRLTIRVR